MSRTVHEPRPDRDRWTAGCVCGFALAASTPESADNILTTHIDKENRNDQR